MARTFEIGLVCAGAISGGAYQAGVLDFLLQALEQWYAAKDSQPAGSVAPHEVSIKVLTGASAGGMSAAILTSMLGDNPVHIQDWNYPVPSGNRLYDSWVGTIDIKELCKTSDLDGDTKAPVTSLLDSTIIDKIASAAIRKQYGQLRPRYFSDPLLVGLSIANMGGVPHVIKMVSSGDDEGVHGLNIRLHQDYREFYLTFTGQAGDGVALDPASQAGWPVLEETAKATGAFPIGLAPRVTVRDLSDYDKRTWCIPKATCDGKGDNCFDPEPIKPTWTDSPPSYSFLTVDGGTMNNTPTELARAKLTGSPCQRLERSGSLADKGLLLVVPFPAFDPPVSTSFTVEEHKANLSLLNSARSLMGAWLEQARFKTEELVLAADEEVYSQFLICPSDAGTFTAQGNMERIDICAATLSGFGAFLFRDFRDHDFQLGRRNCQRFLQHSFALPKENNLFSEWSTTLIQNSLISPEYTHLPIIPLLGTAAVEVPRPFWPRKTTAEVRALRSILAPRVSAVTQRLADTLPMVALKWIAKLVLQFGGAGKLTDSAMGIIEDNLRSHDLMT